MVEDVQLGAYHRIKLAFANSLEKELELSYESVLEIFTQILVEVDLFSLHHSKLTYTSNTRPGR